MSDDPLKFAKLFEVDGEQVLFFLDTDDDEKERLNQIVRLGGLNVNMRAVFDTEEKADAALAKVDQTYAVDFLKRMRAAIRELT